MIRVEVSDDQDENRMAVGGDDGGIVVAGVLRGDRTNENRGQRIYGE